MAISTAEWDRFWSKVVPEPNSGCWLWDGALASGYGVLRVGRRMESAHRLSCEKAHGPIPGGLMALHKCGNRCCVNPDHLYIGNHSDNGHDAAALGKLTRDVVGRRNPNAKLTEDDVRAIRASELGHRQLAKQYGVSDTQISWVRSGKSWGHIQ